MNALQRFYRQLRLLRAKDTVKGEIDEELRCHIEQHTADNITAGMAPEDAARAARKAFGNLQNVREDCRDACGVTLGEETLHDVQFGLRMLAKSPGFSLAALLMLALGIGANTAIFSLVYGVLLRPLPYPEPDRLVTLSEWSEQVPGMSISYPNFLDWHTRQNCFTAMGLFRRESFNHTGTTEPDRVLGTMASHDLRAALGLPLLRGRWFQADDDRVGATRTVVLSDGFWKRRFGGEDAVVGRQVQLNQEAYTVIGVMPDLVQFPGGSTDLWVPVGLWGGQYLDRGNHPGLYALGRLKPGVSLDAARTEMRTIAGQLAREFPSSNAGISVEMGRYTDGAFGAVQTALYVLLGASGFVLLIACANVANLLLIRTQTRSREFAIRTALGAGRNRLFRQLLVESLLLGLLGAGSGLLLGHWLVAALRASSPGSIPRIEGVALNGWVLAFAMSAGLLTTLLFGLAPAIQATGRGLTTVFASSPRAGGTVAGARWRASLVVAEFALTSLLVVGALLMLRTMANLHHADLGYATERVLTFDFQVPRTPNSQPSQRASLLQRGLERLSQLQGVQNVALVTPLPMRGGNQTTYYIEGAAVPEAGRAPSTERIQVSGDYFSTLDIRLVAGRSFQAEDQADSSRVAIVDTLFAQKHFPGQNPLGKRFAYGDGPPRDESGWMRIIGVAAHIQNFGVRQATREQTYVPFTQTDPANVTFTLRTERNPSSVVAAARGAMREVVGDQPIFNFQTMDHRFASSIATERLTFSLLAGFAALALVLASIGLYGVLHYSVAQRTREIGIRVALGATWSLVVSMTLRQGLKLAGTGLLLGLAAAFPLTHLLRSVLYEVSPFDPLSFGAVVGLLAAVGFLACWFPARRAASISPLEALRCD